MSEKEAKKVFLKQVKPYTKRLETEKKRTNPGYLARNRQTTGFKAHIVQGNKYPEFVGFYSDRIRGEMQIVVPIAFTLDAEFAPGAKIDSEAKFGRLLSLCEGA